MYFRFNEKGFLIKIWYISFLMNRLIFIDMCVVCEKNVWEFLWFKKIQGKWFYKFVKDVK